MLSHKLGHIIKEARLQKKLTQSEVVGDFITRNMLSQIESGTAFPSVKTLDYLAKTLDIPMHVLMDFSDEQGVALKDDEASPEKDAFLHAKKLFKREDYQKALEALKPLSNADDDFSDEAWALLARAYLSLAKTTDDIKLAITYANLAEEYSSRGIYASREIQTGAVILLDTLAQKLRG